MLSSVADIETFLNRLEEKSGARLLRKLDLPVSDARRARLDLQRSGITTGSLYPAGTRSLGFARACRTLRGRFFV